MSYVKCPNCGEIIEVPPELAPDEEGEIMGGEPYFCDACDRSDEIDDDGDDGEPDFTLDELEWAETYPELAEMEAECEVCDCGKPFPKNGHCRFCGAHARYTP